ncbi:MAG: ABC transporter substrate-binding protein [Dehalococcoidia bacterium]|nr:ABC transporter substrate-binding protein [Dehalococcoidia bacterium]
MNLGPHLYSKLLRWDGGIENILPDLTTGLPEQVDETTYTYKLKPDTKFSDGSPLTSEDVKFTYERIAKAENASPHRYKAGPLASVDTPDEQTITFKLSEPFAPFISFSATGWMMILSKKFVDAAGDRFQDVLGSGPYVISARQKGVSTQFKRNPNHHNPERPYPDEMDFRVIPDAATLDAAVIANELDFAASGTDKSRIEAMLAANKDLTDMEHASHHWNMFIMNCRDTNLVFKDKRMRQAMNLLIDRELYQAIVHSTGGRPSGPVTWGFSNYAIPQDDLIQRPGYRPDKDEDIKEAKALMEAAGFPDGVKLQCATVTAAAHATYNAGALALKDQLAQYGVELELGVTDMAGIQAKRAEGNFDCMVYVNGGSQEIDEHIYGPHRTGQARNVNGFSNDAIDALLDKQRITLDDAERKSIIMEVQELLLDEVPTAWLADPIYHSLVNKRLIGYQPWLVFDRSSELYDAWIKA